MHDNNKKDDRGYNQGWADSTSTRIRAERRCNALIESMQIEPGRNILEIGCGTGDISFMLAQKTNMQVLGTDLCVPFIEEARKNFTHPGLTYDVLDFNKIETFKEHRFDYIVGNGILHHLYYHLDDALINLKQLLKPKGKIIFWEPNLYNPYIYLIFTYPALRKKAHLEPDEMAFTKPFIEKKLKEAGFTQIKVSFKDFLLPGIPDALIKPSVIIGDVLEKIPLIRSVSQSVFIEASN
ncbi:MAG: class I SAM-dependent methyltransferase [Bacteroidia bacterium]|nr:class I SAM-dependent methyltransferase [Bacteroidia bacterium]